MAPANAAEGLIKEFIFLGSRKKRTEDGIPLSRASLLLGEQEKLTPESIPPLLEALGALGISRDRISFSLTPPAPTPDELETFKKEGKAYDASTQKRTHFALHLEGLDELPEPLTHTALMRHLAARQQVSEPTVQKTQETLASSTRTPWQRVKQEGLWPTMKFYFRDKPLPIIGFFYFAGDMLGNVVSAITNLNLVKTRGLGDFIFSTACGASSILMMGWGDKQTGFSTSESLLAKFDKNFSNSALGAHVPSLHQEKQERSKAQSVDKYLSEHGGLMAKYINAVAPLGLIKAGIDQKNPRQLLQASLAGIGFPVTLAMPKEGVLYEETALHKITGDNGVAKKAFNWLQQRPNALIGLSVLHNIIGLDSSLHNVRRSPIAQEEIRKQFSDPVFQPFTSVSLAADGTVRLHHEGSPQWHEISRNTGALKQHLAMLKDGWVAKAPDGRIRPVTADEKAAIRSETGNHRVKDGIELFRLPQQLEQMPHLPRDKDGNEVKSKYKNLYEAFENNIADYQMFNRLPISAVPNFLMYLTYGVGNALFGLSVEAKKRVHADELYSVAANHILNAMEKVSTQQEALASMAYAQEMVAWLSEQPAVRYAQQTGKIVLKEGQNLQEALMDHINHSASHLAPLTGRTKEFGLWQDIIASFTEAKAQAHGQALMQDAADRVLPSLSQASTQEASQHQTQQQDQQIAHLGQHATAASLPVPTEKDATLVQQMQTSAHARAAL